MMAVDWRRIIGWNGIAGALIVGFVVMVAIAAPLVSPYDPLRHRVGKQAVAAERGPLARHHQAGRDQLSRVIYGARVSLSVAIGAVMIGAVIGLSAGLLARLILGAPPSRLSCALWTASRRSHR